MTALIVRDGYCDSCGVKAQVRHSGRRWLCGECWREHLVESPLPSEPREHFGGDE